MACGRTELSPVLHTCAGVDILKSSVLYTAVFPVLEFTGISSRSFTAVCVDTVHLLHTQVTLHYEALPSFTQPILCCYK